MLGGRLKLALIGSSLCFIVATVFLGQFLYASQGGHVSQNDSPWLDQVEAPLVSPLPASSTLSISDSFPFPSTASASSLAATTSTSVAVNSPMYQTEPLNAPISLDDVLLIFKTGATTIWRRMPAHLTTTLFDHQIKNFVIYSDLEEQLSSTVSTIDVLANETSTLQMYDPEAYGSYLDLESPTHVSTYREHANLPGDESLDADASYHNGWRLDKYKFIPMLAHAQANWPGLRWYIYMEDDTYLFIDNVLSWLPTLPFNDQPGYYGAASGEGNATFAQGGSGIVFSGSLMRSVFGSSNKPTSEACGNETATACCGDSMLGKVLRDRGISVNKGTWGTPSFQPEPPWKTPFAEWMWCSAVYTFHHLHVRDMVMLSELERKHKAKSKQPLRFRDVFLVFVKPYVQQQNLSHWDNFASRYILSNDASLPSELGTLKGPSFSTATSSAGACQEACAALPECMSWRFESVKQTCALDTAVRLGRETDPLPGWDKETIPTVVTSGWMLDRINATLLANECTFF